MKKSFTLASAISLAGAVAMVLGAVTACGDDDAAPNNGSSSGDSGTDAGSNTTDTGTGNETGTASGGLIDPNTVPGASVNYGSCPAFAKCGGELEGNWTITGGCLADTTFDSFKGLCPQLREYDVIIKASGDVTATATTLSQNTKIFLSAKVDLPEACAQLAGGSCDTIPLVLTSGLGGGPSFDHAECTREGATCKCAVDVQVEEDPAPNEYTKDDMGTVTAKSPARTFEYCNQNNAASFRETTANNRSFGMVLNVAPKP